MEGTGLNYEEIYYGLWELSCRYRAIAEFRVIGLSHDGRMIPMLELGGGEEAVFCLAGISGTDRHSPAFLLKTAQEYCTAWECRWKLKELYDLRELLENWKLLFIPLLNPDGYEICAGDYAAVRNPIYRQLLKMQQTPYKQFQCNARGIPISENFPTRSYKRKQIHRQPGSENETRALIRIFQEYLSRGLLSFTDMPVQAGKGAGSPEQYYTELCRRPAFRISPAASGKIQHTKNLRPRNFRTLDSDQQNLYTLPLEYLFSLGSIKAGTGFRRLLGVL